LPHFWHIQKFTVNLDTMSLRTRFQLLKWLGRCQTRRYVTLLCMQKTVFCSIRSIHLVKLSVLNKCSWIFCFLVVYVFISEAQILFTYGKEYHCLLVLVRHVISPCNDLWTSSKVHMELYKEEILQI
jgi:hypothetical protein